MNVRTKFHANEMPIHTTLEIFQSGPTDRQMSPRATLLMKMNDYLLENKWSSCSKEIHLKKISSQLTIYFPCKCYQMT